MSRFLISCGGTGGHLAPGIALAEALHARGHETRLLISAKKVDARMVEKYGNLTFLAVPGSPFGWNPLTLLKCAWTQACGLVVCLWQARFWRPAAIIGFGGFTSAPAVLAGRLVRIPVALHEANRVPGRAVRKLGRFARRVYLPPGVQLNSVRPAAVLPLGLPVRREVVRTEPAKARVALGLDPARPVLAILGGSQGASALNAWVRSRLGSFAAAGVQVYCVTGLNKGWEGASVMKAEGGEARMAFVPFSDRIPEIMSAADLVVSRAGAGTLAELVRCGTPAVLVPFPHAADDHQRANAAYFAEQGGGLVVPEDALADLEGVVRRVLADPRQLAQFRANLQRMDQADPLGALLHDLESLAVRGDRSDESPRSRAESQFGR
jgi:UDP-N-acetylglucosamine--N-acetylmuramyl-(pentapeptide) pyrophosphoryl-undecaprenol N-acetylglucosamine transferase